jgi:hypothetical protein
VKLSVHDIKAYRRNEGIVPTHLQLKHEREVNGQFHTPSALLHRKVFLVSIEQEAG